MGWLQLRMPEGNGQREHWRNVSIDAQGPDGLGVLKLRRPDGTWDQHVPPSIDSRPLFLDGYGWSKVLVMARGWFNTYVLVIDESGSMTTNDPAGLRLQGAINFIDSLPSSSSGGVVGFDDTLRETLAPTTDKAALKALIQGMGAYSGTNIGIGVGTALDMLSTAQGGSIILLTDGEGDYDDLLTQRAVDHGVTIFTIGLTAVTVLLPAIAAATGGAYFYATAAGDIAAAFESIRAFSGTAT